MTQNKFIGNLHQALKKSETDETAKINKILALLAQVSLAVLIIFIMMAILFSSEFKALGEYWKKRAEELAKVPQSIAIIDLQLQKLINALNDHRRYYQKELGHDFFTADEQGRLITETELIISGTTIRNKFKEACQFATKKISNFDDFQKHFATEVLNRAGIVPEELLTDIEMTVNILDEKNREWFKTEVDETTKKLKDDTIEMQDAVLSELTIYFQQHPDQLPDPAIQEQINQLQELSLDDINSTKGIELMESISTLIGNAIPTIMAEQQAPLLAEVLQRFKGGR